jgi:hypothetical protein
MRIGNRDGQPRAMARDGGIGIMAASLAALCRCPVRSAHAGATGRLRLTRAAVCPEGRLPR